jgi:hypothetical protein
MPKSFLASKTLWFNFLLFVVFTAGYFADNHLFVHYAPAFLYIGAAGNFLLRFFTNTPVTLNALPPTPPAPPQN